MRSYRYSPIAGDGPEQHGTAIKTVAKLLAGFEVQGSFLASEVVTQLPCSPLTGQTRLTPPPRLFPHVRQLAMAAMVPCMHREMPPKNPERHPEIALIKDCRQLAMLLQMPDRHDMIAPMLALTERASLHKQR